MAIYRVIPRGLNTTAPPSRLTLGEADTALNVDLCGRPGAIRKRAGSAAWSPATVGAAVLNAAVVTTAYDTYLVVKTTGTGATSLKYISLTTPTAFANWPANAADLATLNGTDPGTFLAHNSCIYYYQAAGRLWWDGNPAGSTFNCGLRPVVVTASLAGTTAGALEGDYFVAFSAYDSARKMESNLTDLYPLSPNVPVFVSPSIGTTALGITVAAAAAASGDKVTHIRLWRNDGKQAVVYDDGTNVLYNVPPMYPETSMLISSFLSGGAVLGRADAALAREPAPYMDNCPPPACSFAAIHNGRGIYITTGGDIYWSHYDRPEQLPIQQGWTSLWMNLWRGLTHGRENTSRANDFDGPVVAVAPAGSGLMAFTVNGAFVIAGGEVKYAQRFPSVYGCIGRHALGRLPGGRLFTLAKQGLVAWPEGRSVSRGRFEEITKSANAAYLQNSVVGYSVIDDALWVAVPSAAKAKCDTLYVIGSEIGTLAKWNFAWADGTTRGIAKILSVSLSNAADYVLVLCDDGTIYKYDGTLNQDAGSNYAASIRLYLATEYISRAKKATGLNVMLGTLGGALAVTLEGLNHPSDSLTLTATSYGATNSNSTHDIIGQTASTEGQLMRLTLASAAGNFGWTVDEIVLETEHDDTN